MRLIDARYVSRIGFVRRLAGAATVALALGGLSGCGGGGGDKFSVDANPLVIQNANLPTTLSGELVNYVIPFTGGGGGPYLLELIDGVLPSGLAFNNATVALVGRILEDGEYDFTIKLTDTGVKPFLSTTQHYHWSISKGALVFATDAVLPSYVFNRFDVLNLLVAGGTAPYSCEVIDVPAVADELLPNGLSIPADSNSIVGAPVGVKASTPFIYKVSIKATDHTVPTPLTVVKLFTITVLVPDVIVTTSSVPNGVCGQAYTSKVNIVDGIAPFYFTLVDAPASNNPLVGEPGTPALPPVGNPTLAGLPATPAGITKGTVSGAFRSAYDADTSNGSGSAAAPSYNNRFPEGIYMRESTGDILGIPRRRGTFANWNFHVQSSVLPAVPGQNKWKQYTFAMADSVPTNVALDNSVLLPGNVFSAPGNNYFQGPSKGLLYSKQFIALNGCGQDAKFDGPHESQAIANPSEAVGRYDFTGTVFASGVPAGMTFSGTGLFSGTATGTSVFQTVTVSAEDSQLPLPRAATHKATGTCQFEIGPDIVVITETSAGDSQSLFNNNSDFNSQTVEILLPTATGPIVRALTATDMVLTRTHPVAGGTLVGSLTAIDILRVSVNPTWWAYDGYNLNAKGARTMQHADPERRHPTEAFGSDCAYAFYETPANHNQSREHASNPAIELPKATTVSHSPTTGVYNTGGLLYGYDNSTEFGFFIVRKDSMIDIPVAFNKSASGFKGFGDGWIKSDASYTGQFRIPQITVSPDGRMAAAKLKIDTDVFNEVATNERVVLFSLTGETMFGGATFVTLTTGGSGDTTDGQYLYGSSLTLTNYGLYALRGNNIGTIANNGDRVIYAEHWVWKASIFNPSTFAYLTPTTMSLLASGFGGTGGWLNSASNPVSCCFQRWMTHGSSTAILAYGSSFPSSGLISASQPYDGPTSAFTSGGQTNAGGSVIATSPDFWHFSYANFGDNSGAPHPFRVSANGHACAIVGGANQSAAVTTGVGSTTFLNRSVYVDYDNNFREAATAPRRYKSSSRTVGFYAGEPINRHYGWYDGPATQFEISDDGLNIAAVYNASTSAWTTLIYNAQSFADSREELACMRATSATPDPWATRTNTLVTNGIFSTTYNHNWRIGCLAFTRNNTAFTFWAGVSLVGPTTYTYSYRDGCTQAGSLYAYTLGTSLLEGILPSAQGGHIDITGAAKTYNVGTPNNYPIAAQTNNGGAVKPGGSFFSNDGKFYWIECTDNIDPSNANFNAHRLIGVNVGDLTTTINTRVPLRAFAPAWNPLGKCFSPGTSYPYAYPGQYYYAGGAFNKVATNISCAGTNGLIFYASYHQSQSQGAAKYSGTSSWSSGSNALSTGWNTYLGSEYYAELFGIDASLGGSPTALTSLGNQLRTIPYIQPSEDGKRVAFVMSCNGSNYGNYETVPVNERLSIISGITVSGTGTLSATSPVVLEGTSGRVSSSLALDTSGTKVYYGFSTNGNENGMVLKEVTLNAAGTAVVGSPRTFNGVSGTANRFAVLWSGR